MVQKIKDAFSIDNIIRFMGLILLGAGLVWGNKYNIEAESQARASEILAEQNARKADIILLKESHRHDIRLIQANREADQAKAASLWARQEIVNTQARGERKELLAKQHSMELATQNADKNYQFILELIRTEKAEDSAFRSEMRRFTETCLTTEDIKNVK